MMRISVAGGTGTVGRHVVDVLREQGHAPVVLSRSAGVDLLGGSGLATVLDGVDAVVDVTSVQTRTAAASESFFETVTQHLQQAEQQLGVRHHVLLGIVGSDKAPYAYYAGKVRQEQLVEAGAVPSTILRATQFYEFAAQIRSQLRAGPFSIIPAMRSQPIAARAVAERLVELAVAAPQGRVPDVAGPAEHRMVEMVRRLAEVKGWAGPVLELPIPGRWGRALRDGTLLAGPGAELRGPGFAEWLASGAGGIDA
jgi:uncharacterized protein YbjT (DUF2867 family)